MCPELLHVSKTLNERGRRPCVWCEKVRSSVPVTCVLCGELFCGSDCFSEFHNQEPSISKQRKGMEVAAAAEAEAPGTQRQLFSDASSSSDAASSSATASVSASRTAAVVPASRRQTATLSASTAKKPKR